MDLDVDLSSRMTVEFGLLVGRGEGRRAVIVGADGSVQDALVAMVQATSSMADAEPDPRPYNPAEKYATSEYSYLSLADPLAEALVQLQDATNIPSDPAAFDHPEEMSGYFARFTDASGKRLTGIKRATQFKGVLHARLLRILDASLMLVEDDVFKLDSDFDVLIDSKAVHVIHAAGLEVLADLQAAILASVPANVGEMRAQVPFMDLAPIQTYALTHPRAARYIASIRSFARLGPLDMRSVARLCRETDVDAVVRDGKLVVAAGSELAFLEVLDRRRYEVMLVRGNPERFRAASRASL